MTTATKKRWTAAKSASGGDEVLPMSQQTFTIKNQVLCALFTALIVVGAFLRIPIPVIPFTLQFLFTTLAGILLGPGLGAVSVLCYILLGLAGFPVFAAGGGIAYVLQPSFGYLIGFCLGAYVTGMIANRVPKPSLKRLLSANFSGLLIVYALGMAYCWIISRFYLGDDITVRTLLLYCFLLPIPGDLFICVVAAILGKRLLPILRQNQRS